MVTLETQDSVSQDSIKDTSFQERAGPGSLAGSQDRNSLSAGFSENQASPARLSKSFSEDQDSLALLSENSSEPKHVSLLRDPPVSILRPPKKSWKVISPALSDP